MADTRTIGAFATTLASMGTLFFTLFGLSMSTMPSIDFQGHIFGGYVYMVWFGVVALAFGWASAAYTYEAKHYDLSVTGAAFTLISSIVETIILIYAPYHAIPPIVTLGPVILLQLVASLVGIIFTAKSKRHFTS